MKKKRLGLVMASAALLLAACGSDSDAGKDSAGTNTDGSATSQTAGGDYSGQTLKISARDDYTDFVKAVIPDFEKEFDVTIDLAEKDMFDNLEALPLDGPAEIGPSKGNAFSIRSNWWIRLTRTLKRSEFSGRW